MFASKATNGSSEGGDGSAFYSGWPFGALASVNGHGKGARLPVGELLFQRREQVHQTKPKFGQFSPDPFRMQQSHIGE
jgi:hypothetical protein